MRPVQTLNEMLLFLVPVAADEEQNIFSDLTCFWSICAHLRRLRTIVFFESLCLRHGLRSSIDSPQVAPLKKSRAAKNRCRNRFHRVLHSTRRKTCAITSASARLLKPPRSHRLIIHRFLDRSMFKRIVFRSFTRVASVPIFPNFVRKNRVDRTCAPLRDTTPILHNNLHRFAQTT
jgi:hypothetical protein